MRKKVVVNVGDEFFYLKVINELPIHIGTKGNKKRKFLLQCKCGNTIKSFLTDLKAGKTKSCGCYNKVKKITHGLTKTKIYSIYKQIVQRCNNTNCKAYKDYGGRGIRCEWNTFEDFYRDMFSSYKEGLTIDRIDVNGNYCKENCKWSTQKEQANNKRNTIYYKGKSISEWSEILGIKYVTIKSRMNQSGRNIEKALFTNVKEKGKNIKSN